MPLTPCQASVVAIKRINDQVRMFCDFIDQKLPSCFDTVDRKSEIEFKGNFEPNPIVENIIVGKYKQVGWAAVNFIKGKYYSVILQA